MIDRKSILGLRFPSFYIEEYAKAVRFYTDVFGKPESDEPKLKGWRLGDTWLTLFPSVRCTEPGTNPRNAEFAIQVRTPGDVDRLYEELVHAGASEGGKPEDTWMYDPMRFCYVDDPVGIRIDVYCPIRGKEEKA